MEIFSWKPYISSNIFAQYKKKNRRPCSTRDLRVSGLIKYLLN